MHLQSNIIIWTLNMTLLTLISWYTQRFRRGYIYNKINYLTFDFKVKVTQNVAQYPKLHVAYALAKFEAATSNGLKDTITRNVTDVGGAVAQW